MAKERLTKVASVRFSEADWAEIVKEAEREGMDPGAYVRACTLTAMAGSGNKYAARVVAGSIGRGLLGFASKVLGLRRNDGESPVAAP